MTKILLVDLGGPMKDLRSVRKNGGIYLECV